MTGLIIYLTGIVATWILLSYHFVKKNGYINIGNIGLTLIASVCSWLFFIAFIFIFYSNEVIYRKKEKK